MAVTVLFISSHDSARGQMAEGLLRELGGDTVQVFSAGSEGFGVDPRALLAMAERGIDIGGQRSRGLDEYITSARFDYLITVCRREERDCPVYPGMSRREYWAVEDPARRSARDEQESLGEDEDDMARFRDVRDRLEARIVQWLDVHRRELTRSHEPEPVSVERQAA